MKRPAIFSEIEAERERQTLQWAQPHMWGKGDCSSHGVSVTVKATVLSEECGEVCRAVLDGDDEALRTELIQVAAVAVGWLEGLS